VRFENVFKILGMHNFATLVFGLPGGPSAVMQSFEQYVKPALLKMMGHRHVPRGAAQWRDMSNQISGGYRNEICGDRL